MSKYTLENNKGLLDEIYPDRLWANNLGIVIRWLDESYLLKMKDKDIYFKYRPQKQIKKNFKKTAPLNNPFKVLKNLNLN